MFNKHKGQRLLAVVILFFVILNYPILSVFSRQGLIFGIPILYFWLFSLWLFLIIWTAQIIEKNTKP